MLLTIELTGIFLCTLMCVRPIQKILNGSFNIMYFCMLSFWAVQVFPLIMKAIYGVDPLLSRYPKTFTAMNDDVTCILYVFFIIFVEFYIYVLARTLPDNGIRLNTLKEIISRFTEKSIIKVLLFAGMFFEVFLIPLSPKPNVYFRFSYFYTNIVKESAQEFIFQYSIMSIGTRIAFFSIILFYLLYSKSKVRWCVYIAVAILTWINGKRTLLTIVLLAIIVVDLVKTENKSERKSVIKKAIVFCIIIVWFFNLYSEITGKMASTSFNFQYSIYFGRMSNVDACIYAELNDEYVLSYRGQSIMYDLFFWIPRTLWDAKPVLYSKYFTAYVMGYKTIDINWQFQTNIWSEYISNFSFLGPFIAVAVLYLIAYLSQKSNNTLVYIMGLIYAVMYTMYGFEAMVQILGMIWLLLIVFNRFRYVRVVVRR